MSNTSDDTSILSRLLTFLWDHTIAHAFYVFNFRNNRELLNSKMEYLSRRRKDVKKKVDDDERNGQMTRTSVVDGWLLQVDTVEQEVRLILDQASQQIEDWWTFYEVGREMSKKLAIVLELCEKGNFEIVSEKSPPRSVEEIHVESIEGMEAMFNKVWGLLGDDDVKILGIFGMGGVGKTTLLSEINNAFFLGPNQFEMVIWVVVSREFTVSNVQKQISERLGLLWLDDEEQNKNKKLISNALRKKKNFLLVLDDLWEAINLKSIGIPSLHNRYNNSKVVFTTRSESVCGRMAADKKLRVPTLDLIQAWNLFRKKVGQEVLDSDQEIQKIAKEVAGKCDGLPLALITIGSAMSSKKTIHEWEHARTTLTKYAHEFEGMEALFSTLKFSYDALGNDTIKQCFLYCALFPKDPYISVRDLVQAWIGEGYLDNYQDMEDAFNKGIDIIGILKSACLLEKGPYYDRNLRMHNIVRELALWIAREKNNKWFVEDTVESTQSLDAEVWKSAERVMSRAIIQLPPKPNCPCLLTLRFLKSSNLLTISSGFFMYMPILRVLDLSETGITEVPESVGCLSQLQYLDLSYTKITEVPESVGNLTNLRFLNLRNTLSLRIVPLEKISRLSRLQMLNLWGSGIEMTSANLECLEHVRELGVDISDMKALDSILLSQRLKSSVRYLYLYRCEGLTGLASLFRIMKKLQFLSVASCLEMKQLIGGETEDKDMCSLSTLEYLQLTNLPKLNITWNETAINLHFKKLWCVEITNCGLLKDISWILLAPNLTMLSIKGCGEVERVLLDGFPRSMAEKQSTFSTLELLLLIDLPKLECISQFTLLFPCLKNIGVTNCPLLTKLPFTSDSTNKPSLRIGGSSEWWNGLQWQDEATKSSFQPFFIVS